MDDLGAAAPLQAGVVAQTIHFVSKLLPREADDDGHRRDSGGHPLVERADRMRWPGRGLPHDGGVLGRRRRYHDYPAYFLGRPQSPVIPTCARRPGLPSTRPRLQSGRPPFGGRSSPRRPSCEWPSRRPGLVNIQIEGQLRSIIELRFAAELYPCPGCGSREIGEMKTYLSAGRYFAIVSCPDCRLSRKLSFHMRSYPPVIAGAVRAGRA